MDELRLSELVDGELDRDEANALLLETLDDAQARAQLKGLLQLRHVLAKWRRQSPPGVRLPMLVRSVRRSLLSQPAGYAAAAAIGGLLVMSGFLLARSPGRNAAERTAPSAMVLHRQELSPETVRQTAQVFAFHESVGGPLKWYASDDRQVQLASFDEPRSLGEPIVVYLDLVADASAGAASRQYTVVCRAGQQATMDFPAEPGKVPGVQIQMLPSLRGGEVELRYIVDLHAPKASRERWVSLAGQNVLGRQPMKLGVAVLDGHHFTLVASSGRLNAAFQG